MQPKRTSQNLRPPAQAGGPWGAAPREYPCEELKLSRYYYQVSNTQDSRARRRLHNQRMMQIVDGPKVNIPDTQISKSNKNDVEESKI